MKKVIIINGSGGSGKDTFIKIAKELYEIDDFEIANVSSIDPIKRALRKYYGWDGKNKSDEWRRKMVALKETYAKKDLPTHYLIDKINKVKRGIVFLHIREPHEIEKVMTRIEEAHTLHVARPQVSVPNTKVDMKTTEYRYDTSIVNDGETEEDLKHQVKDFFEQIVPTIDFFDKKVVY
jgi:adenylate kinase family enzyme